MKRSVNIPFGCRAGACFVGCAMFALLAVTGCASSPSDASMRAAGSWAERHEERRADRQQAAAMGSEHAGAVMPSVATTRHALFVASETDPGADSLRFTNVHYVPEETAGPDDAGASTASGTEVVDPAAMDASADGTLEEVAEMGEPEEFNDGQDPTRPLWRFDTRYRYQQTTGDVESHIGTFRIDMPVALNEEKGIPGGAIYTRFDLPVTYTNQPGTDNRNADYEFELTDSLMQNIFLPEFAWVKRNTPFDAIAVGVQWGFPTGTADFASREKFAIAPVFAWKWDLDGPSTFIAPVWRFRQSFADVNNGESRDDVSELTLQPLLSISTKDWGWPIDFITFYETQEIKLNFEDGDRKSSGNVFIPFEVEVGKVVGKTVYSIDFAFPIYKSPGFDSYDWFVEARVGFLF